MFPVTRRLKSAGKIQAGTMVDSQAKKCAKRVEDLDHISQLPEPIQIHILSFVSKEEAARTSILSKCWKNLWMSAFHEFDFDASVCLPPVKVRYFNWVNEALRSHCKVGSVLYKLRLNFPLELEQLFHEQIDECLSYAFAGRVRCLELKFLPHSYSFPGRLVAETDLSCLRSLSLSDVHVSREHIDSVLFKFRFLEHLRVCKSPALRSIEIGRSSSSALKHLEMMYCYRLENVILRDTGLVSLMVNSVINLVIENNLKLVSLCISTWYINDSSQRLQMLSRLQDLTLFFNYYKSEDFLDQVPLLSELKKLTLIVDPERKETCAHLTTLLSLSPNLEKFVLELVKPSPGPLQKNIPCDEGLRLPLHHLRDVEVRGYYGRVVENKLLMHIFKLVATPIEKVIFDPRNLRHEIAPLPSQGFSRRVMNDEKRAKLLRELIPSSAEFIVL